MCIEPSLIIGSLDPAIRSLPAWEAIRVRTCFLFTSQGSAETCQTRRDWRVYMKVDQPLPPIQAYCHEPIWRGGGRGRGGGGGGERGAAGAAGGERGGGKEEKEEEEEGRRRRTRRRAKRRGILCEVLSVRTLPPSGSYASESVQYCL